MSLSLICRIEQSVTGGVTSTVFPITEELLNDTKYQKALKHIGSRKNMNKYRSMMDFLFCELFPSPWRQRCFQYYDGKGKQLKDSLDACKLMDFDLQMRVALEMAVATQEQNLTVTWKEFKESLDALIASMFAKAA